MSTRIYPGMRRRVQLDKIECDWCYGTPATWKIIDQHSLSGYANACTAHGTEWYPALFPASDPTPIEQIIADIPIKVDLTKSHDQELVAAWADWINAKRHAQTSRPWYPLVGHRDGLRANDPITLASAFWIECNERGVARNQGPWAQAEQHPHQGLTKWDLADQAYQGTI